jgi:predicted O-linked N-acetylglucosamine transferase (SPINDLY family)
MIELASALPGPDGCGADATPDDWVAQGYAQLELRRDTDSLQSFERALIAAPDHLNARIGRSRALLRLGQKDLALLAIERVLHERPEHARAHGIHAQILRNLGRTEQARQAAEHALVLDPEEPTAFMVLGQLHLGRKDFAAAIPAFDRALRANPRLAVAARGRADALAAMSQAAEAIDAYALAARLDPTVAAPLVYQARLNIRYGQLENAVEAFTHALEREPDCIAALQGRAQSLNALGRPKEALDAYSRLLEAAPQSDYMIGERFHVQMQCCDWNHFETTRSDIARRVRGGERVDFPGSFNTHCDAPSDQLICAQTYAADVLDAAPLPECSSARMGSDRIRIGYLSADFFSHATAFLAAGLFEAHDRAKFEVYAFSYGQDDGSDMRRRLRRAFDHFVDVREFSDERNAALIRDLGIDIAVDLKGHTLGARPAVLAARPAPLQVSFLAYPATMGVEFIDYLVADRQVIPESDQDFYSESIIYLPGCYQVNDSARQIGPPPSRAAAGLPSSGFVFCCFNGSYKITPPMFDSWMRILTAVPDSILWLLRGADCAVENLRAEAARRGVDPGRLVFAPRRGAADHLARCALADLFLDTHPCTAHTTASDALWAGVPLVTLSGSSFMSRVATSLLHAVDLSPLAVRTPAEYEKLAIHLALAPLELDALKSHLHKARFTSTLFDTAGYARNLEAAFDAIWNRHVRGERPSVLHVDAGDKVSGEPRRTPAQPSGLSSTNR